MRTAVCDCTGLHRGERGAWVGTGHAGTDSEQDVAGGFSGRAATHGAAADDTRVADPVISRADSGTRHGPGFTGDAFSGDAKSAREVPDVGAVEPMPRRSEAVMPSSFALKFPELTFSNRSDPWSKRATIRVIEWLAGRNYFVPLYEHWQTEFVAKGGPVMQPMLDILEVTLRIKRGSWPPKLDPAVPLIIIANHPFGIVDGFAALALAEKLGRPYRILINKDLLKVPEVRPYSLAVNFEETREAQAENIKMRNEALRLLKLGTTIIVFPSGGVATSPSIHGPAVDLPWKTFTARMIMASRAQVVPLFFEGQCRPLFHRVSRYSLTLRLSLIIAELRRRVKTDLGVRIGPLLSSADLQVHKDRISLMNFLFDQTWGLADQPLSETRADMEKLPGWLTGQKEKE